MRTFSARETEWLQELDGIELAGFWQRAIAFGVDSIVLTILFSVLATLFGMGYLEVLHLRGKPVPGVTELLHRQGNSKNFNFKIGEDASGSKDNVELEKLEHNELLKIVNDVAIPILYFGILLWHGKGRTPGKRLTKIRVVSVMHRHLSFWHCVERALGYGAAALEGGFGFVQFFIHPYRRCAQDRLAETIVVTERSYQALQHRLSHPLIPDGALNPPPDTI
ncbi:hypothetical protein GOB94_05095 [Granulicella sp. 5B5]|uniref:RDD family protein n=1 Tax=Granulicella sp. 5B5 TaxID=1617967 RepID=UPI0015F4A277|nr:RDD family protein [Granulicella sp. 5B5]QMV18137.1 hypothetical protein GOB94_05095 [Granulicella sp. 5B5]